MKAYIAIKFHPDHSNRHVIHDISSALTAAGYKTMSMQRDVEKFGTEANLPASELMKLTFEMIDACQLVVVELTEKGVGLGIEAGYAYAKGVKIVTIAKKGSDVSTTLRGVSDRVVLFDEGELEGLFKDLVLHN